MHQHTDTTELQKDKRTQRVLLLLLLGLLVFIDQVTKKIVFAGSWPSSEKLVHLTKFRNYDFAFSLPIPEPVMYIMYTAIAISCVIYLKKRFSSYSQTTQLFWSLIIAGGISNIGERIALGYVRDFLVIPFGGIINVADIYIIVGIVYLIIYNDKRRSKSIFSN